jgi:hypothetical protein
MIMTRSLLCFYYMKLNMFYCDKSYFRNFLKLLT